MLSGAPYYQTSTSSPNSLNLEIQVQPVSIVSVNEDKIDVKVQRNLKVVEVRWEKVGGKRRIRETVASREEYANGVEEERNVTNKMEMFETPATYTVPMCRICT